MARRRVRIPLFLKFLIGCLALAALLIVGGSYVVKNETQLRSRGNYLQKSARRLAGYVERVGQGMTGTLDILSADPALQAAFVISSAVGETQRDRAIAEIGKRMYDQLSAKNGLHPDAFAIFSSANELLWTPPKSPITEPELPQLGAV